VLFFQFTLNYDSFAGQEQCPTNRNYRLEALTEERKPVLAVDRQGASTNILDAEILLMGYSFLTY
jgi:hypothetical protein